MFGLHDDTFGTDTTGTVSKDAVHREVTASIGSPSLHQPLDVLMVWDVPQQVVEKAFEAIIVQSIPRQRQRGCPGDTA
ncbi:hypothetical protein IX27_01815 [Streptomyces sp. JS01]|nr:hypothetical protein IX27_01815 [Streptomyces sp. JS01]